MNSQYDCGVSDADIQIIIPMESNNSEQLLAYREFINVLAAILVKYAAEMNTEI